MTASGDQRYSLTSTSSTPQDNPHFVIPDAIVSRDPVAQRNVLALAVTQTTVAYWIPAQGRYDGIGRSTILPHFDILNAAG
jgi:hypothetical protein